jgi:hypothetical protein
MNNRVLSGIFTRLLHRPACTCKYPICLDFMKLYFIDILYRPFSVSNPTSTTVPPTAKRKTLYILIFLSKIPVKFRA